MPLLNYPKGFRRIGIVAAVIWTIAILAYAHQWFPATGSQPDYTMMFLSWTGGLVMLFVAYFVALLVLRVVFWIVDGFTS